MKRIPQLDGLRGIAVLMVFGYHALHVPLFWSGVDLFFVLSGFLITGILLRLKQEYNLAGYWSAFYFRRLLRIAPPYIGFLIVVSLLFSIPWRHCWYWYAFFGANLASILGKCPLNSMQPLWSLAVEEQFYFIWPWVVLFTSRQTLKKITIAIMVAAPLLRAVFTPILSNRAYIYDLTPFRADLLACGAFVALCVSDDPEWLRRSRLPSFVTFTVAGLVLAGASAFHGFRLSADSESFNTFGYSLILLVYGSALVGALGIRPGWVQKILASRPLRFMGQISYTFYLYQLAVMDKLAQYIHSKLEVVSLGFLLTAVFSLTSWRLFESQILKLRLQPRPAPSKVEVA